MDTIFENFASSPKFQSIVLFLINFIYYLIPCLMGSIVNFFLKRRDHCDYRPIHIILYSITPSIILSMTEELLKARFELSSPILLGTSFLSGLVCDEITNMFSTFKNILKLYSQFKNIINAIKNITDEIEKLTPSESDENKCDTSTKPKDSS